MANKKVLLLVLFIFSLLQTVSALDVNRGKIRLRVIDVNGRYSVYYAPDLSNPKFTPLFLADDPTTSLSTLQIDGVSYPLVVGQGFKCKVEETPSGARITWTSTKVEVLQNFDFISSPGSGVTDGLRVTYQIKNLTPQNMRGGLKILIDTYLGEKGVHFTLKNGAPIQDETILYGSDIQNIISTAPGAPATGLMISFDSSATRPHHVLFSNWKRLNSADWEIASVKGRNFNLLPYSFNDSAICLYYENILLPPGDPTSVVLNLGNSGVMTFEGAKMGTDNAYSDILDVARTSSVEDLRIQQKKDQAMVDDLLNSIDSGVDSNKQFSQEDIKILQAILDELTRRKALYTDK